MSDYFRSSVFEGKYHYIGEDLGVTYNTQVSIFKVWAPEAESMTLLLYREGNGGEPIEELAMTYGEKGIWHIARYGNVSGLYYNYLIRRNGISYEVTDPYAKAVGVNGKRGMIINLANTNPKGWAQQPRPKLKSPVDAIIYELHIRDLSMDPYSGIYHKGKYLGLTETGTVTPEGEKTGLDHLKELGVTHIQLLPCYDFISIDESRQDNNAFNWGYDPQNYNVPEGSYATDPYHGEVRIKEYKKMIMSLHENGLGVIMDVVYNHTAQGEDSKLNRLMPHYYHRVLENGQFSNGSGCGNEIASERFMVRKMIIDSLIYWVKEYKIDGFRFDLMGILDIETMNAIRQALEKINPAILLYGEGWTGGLCALGEDERAVKRNTWKIAPIGVFNDDFRDAIKGNAFRVEDRGFIAAGYQKEETIKFGMIAATSYRGLDYSRVDYTHASYTREPAQSINYVSAHDDLTLWDKIQLSMPGLPIAEKIKMQKLSGALILLAQGVPFLHAGIEFARTKYKDHNSYRSPDKINCLTWRRKTIYREIFDYYKGLIALRKAHPAFRITTTRGIQERLTFLQMPKGNMVGFSLKSTPQQDEWQHIVVIFNGNEAAEWVNLAYSGWYIVVDGQSAGNECLMTIDGDSVMVSGRSAFVLIKA